MTQPIDRYMPQTGRHIRETGELVNLADLFFYQDGLPLAVANNTAGVFSADVSVDSGETVGLNLFFDKKTIISRVDVSDGGIQPLIRDGLSTGDYQEVISSYGLNRLESWDDNSQAQVVGNASASGAVLADGNITNGIITDGTMPITVLFENPNGTAISESVLVTFFELNQVSVLTLLESDTLLSSDTEMSQYGAS